MLVIFLGFIDWRRPIPPLKKGEWVIFQILEGRKSIPFLKLA